MISVKGLSKSYTISHDKNRPTTLAETFTRRIRHPFRAPADTETFWALKDVSFDVKRGDVVGVVGRNGAGKSTLFKVLSRITEPTEGQIDLYGRVGSLLEVGTGFSAELTGRENIYLNGTILGMKRAEISNRFDEIVDFAGVENFLDTPVKRYSSGMYVRLAFAVAAYLDTEILVVDEVLAVGDQQFQEKCLGKLQDVAKSGRTVLYVSHSMSTVVSICTWAMMLDRGTIVSAGPTSEIVDQYLSYNLARSNRGMADAKPRPGTGELRYVAVAATKPKFTSAEPKTISFTIEEAASVTGSITLSAHVRNDSGTIIVQCDSRLIGVRFDSSGRTGLLTIETPYLKPGRYWIDVGILSSVLIDLFFDACSFEVGPELPFNKSAPPESYMYGVVFSEFEWQLT